MALGTYNTDGTKQTPKEYYSGTEKGNYQFISITDIINNFIVSQVGDDKIIKSAKRAEVAFHAQRGIQELNYDTINNLKTQEIELPPSLSVDLPHDFVSYVQISMVDDNGIERPIKPSPVSTAPTSVLQDSDYNYLFDSNGNLLVGSSSLTVQRFQTSTNDTSVKTTDSSINFLEEGYGYNVDFGKRYGLDPTTATRSGFFIIDDNNGTISFSSDLKEKVITIKYISDGLSSDGDMRVHKFAEEALYKCIAHGIMTAKSNVPEYQINRLKKERRAALRSAKLRLAKINITDLTQTMRGKSKHIKH